MDWLLDNLQILFVIAAGVAYWLNSMRQAKEEARQQRDEPPHDPDEVFGPDFDFNEQPPPRQSEVFLPPPVAPPPYGSAPPPPLPGQRSPSVGRERRDFPAGSPTPQRPVSPHQARGQENHNAELERQRSLEERIMSLRKNRDKRGSGAAATQRSVVARRNASRGVSDEVPISIDGIRSRLRSPREARRAIVLREILDTPVGMK